MTRPKRGAGSSNDGDLTEKCGLCDLDKLVAPGAYAYCPHCDRVCTLDSRMCMLCRAVTKAKHE